MLADISHTPSPLVAPSPAAGFPKYMARGLTSRDAAESMFWLKASYTRPVVSTTVTTTITPITLISCPLSATRSCTLVLLACPLRPFHRWAYCTHLKKPWRRTDRGNRQPLKTSTIGHSSGQKGPQARQTQYSTPCTPPHTHI